MSKSKNETTVTLKRIKPRYVVIQENIHSALDIHTFSLYMAFRYESDYASEDAIIKRSAKFLYEKAKISRRQFFLSLNVLEAFGLVLRASENQLNSISSYHVAQELNYFNTNCGVVHDMHGVVHHMHTDHYSLSSSIINNTSSVSEETNASKKVTKDQLIEDIKQIYHEELPDLPKIKTVDAGFKGQLNKMVKSWPAYQAEGESFSLESFRNYLRVVKNNYGWLLKPYETESGNQVKCSLRKLTRDINISKIVNGEFSASKS